MSFFSITEKLRLYKKLIKKTKQEKPEKITHQFIFPCRIT